MAVSPGHSHLSTDQHHEFLFTDTTSWWSAAYNDTSYAGVTATETVFQDDLLSNMAVRVVLIVSHVTASLVAIVGNAFVLFVIRVRIIMLRESVTCTV